MEWTHVYIFTYKYLKMGISSAGGEKLDVTVDHQSSFILQRLKWSDTRKITKYGC